MQQIKITCEQNEVEFFETVLEKLGALSVTVTAADDEEIFEPELNTSPLWQHCVISALFEKPIDINLIPNTNATIEASDVKEQDWQNIWKQEFSTMRFGDRLVICPSHETPEKLDDFTIVLDPGLAFGTGTHPTTAMCLQWLDANIKGNEVIIDYGCGSGILAIAASKLGAKKVYAVDIDPQALMATRENAKNNHVNNIETFLPGELPDIKADVIIANILTNPLKQLASVFRELIKEGGKIALSGILCEQVDEVVGAYDAYFSIKSQIRQEKWAMIDGIVAN